MIELCETECTSKKTYTARDRSIFKHLKAYFGEETLLQDVEKSLGEYERHRTTQGTKPATIAKELGLFKRMFNVARIKWRWVKDNPVSLIEMPQVRNERTRYLSPYEHDRLLEALSDARIPPWLEPIIVMAINTGPGSL